MNTIKRIRLAFREFAVILRTGSPTFDEANAAFWVKVGGREALKAAYGTHEAAFQAVREQPLGKPRLTLMSGGAS